MQLGLSKIQGLKHAASTSIDQKPDVQEMLAIKGIGRAVPDRFV